jgi:hypothetical protein
MAKKRAWMSDEELLARISPKVQECARFTTTKLSTERTRVLDYYNSKLPARQHPGASSYVSTDVYDSVEAMKAQLLETFAGNDDEIIKFPPQTPDDVESSRIATEYTSYVVFRQNNGYELFNDVIHDGLTARVGVAKVYWEEIFEDEEEEFTDLPYEEVQGLVAQEDITDLDATMDEATGLFTGRLTRRVDKSKVTLEAVPAEEFVIDNHTRCVKDARIIGQRTAKTRAELKAMGYDAKVVDELPGDADELLLDQETIARREPTDNDKMTDDPVEKDQEKVIFYEVFARVNRGNGSRLWKVCFVGSTVLSVEEVDRAPFIVFVPLPVPHTFYGNNFAARVIPTQNARTVLTRAILDHTAITTNPRWQVVKGGLLNPREMLDNRLGGLVNVTRPDALLPIPYANLNPFVFQTLEMLKANKEESTGISSLSQGLNKDAISTQNSQGLIDNLVTLSQQRQKIVARNFALNFLAPLFLEVYRLVLENEKQDKVIEVAGNFIPVSPYKWASRVDCKVSLHLGYGERDMQAQKYAMLYQQLAADPALAPMFKPENRYKLVTDGMKMAGFKNFAEYITDPAEIDPPQPDPMKVKELEIKDKTATAAAMQAQAAVQKVQAQTELDAVRLQLEELNASLKAALDARESERLDAETENRIDVAQREVALLERSKPENVNSIASPNG